MPFREFLTACSKGDQMAVFWLLYRLQNRAEHKLTRDFWTFLLNRSARRHGGYVGPGAVIAGEPVLPHGLHGVYISRFAVIGTGCRIYQNVTIGEVDGRAPVIGDDCLIGAGAVLVGNIRIGNHVKIGAGAVIRQNLPDGCTAVAQPPRILERGTEHDEREKPGLAGNRPERPGP